ncbi:MAG TPA: nucleoside-diphosphate sugar epimerase/dehydratase [Verrucomicrobiota bacterium]|nr:nucleoside-diphosphate sugar epimerase/dehydratase [Verrucomicrobiota bacterium]HNU49881.1 nucleoside-diphosphate sugar epimerase/dehydratase [Verrucomicrobiota bacterium]
MGWEQMRRSNTFRFVFLLGMYSFVLLASHWLAYQLRFDFHVPESTRPLLMANWQWEVPLKLAALFLFGQFSGLLSYFSIPDMQRVVMATGSVSVGLFLIRYMPFQYPVAPRSVVMMDFILMTVGILGVRIILRTLRERFFNQPTHPVRHRRRVGIIGAGDVGASLVRELQVKRGLGLEPVALFDDDPAKWKSNVHGIPVLGAPELLREGQRNLQLEEVIIAMPTAPAKRLGEVVRLLQGLRLRFETVPSIDQLATGKVRVSKLRSVEIQDLLGREPVTLATENIRHILRDQVVLVTGAGGSIGSELCRQIAAYDPQRLLLVDQSEVQLFQIEQELLEQGCGGVALPLVADILDTERMRQIFERFRPRIVFHAAAHKHVPMMESQPGEAIKNNSLGTVRLAELALEFRVERFVMISTDKAINPTSVMGASKRLAEIFLQALHARHPDQTRFITVRFGNVLGSSGSVIPIFQKQIAAGGPVTVTHPDVTRYFMTIPEAAGLVLQSATQGTGGEIYVLDMGKPVRIVDLAHQLIELSGLIPEEDVQVEFVGLRPGEKLFEELSYKGEDYTATEHPKIMRFSAPPVALEDVQHHLDEMLMRVHDAEPSQLKRMLQTAVPEYQPYLV